jgi:uncharacterized alkaline shock family protein YloU
MMNLVFRVMLAVYASCLSIVSIVLMIFMFRDDLITVTSDYIVNNILPNRNASILLFVVELIFFGLSMTFLLSGMKSSPEKRAITRITNIGEIRISLNAIETIALNATKKISGIKETKAFVKKHGDSVVIFIRYIAMSDINLPALGEDIQVKVKKTVEDMTGTKVHEVTASAENVYAGYKSRVE